MTYRRLCAALLCSVLLVSAAGCDDSANVGLSVGPDSLNGGEPVTLDAVAGTFTALDEAPVTGNTSGLTTWRFLAGGVNDPLSGTVTAEGYFDVLQPTLSSPVIDTTTDALDASIEVFPSYIHGDTTATLTLEVYDATDEMDVTSARADTTFSTGATPVASASFVPTDSVVTIDLPASWIQANEGALRDTTDDGNAFAEAFHGFKLVARGGNAVVGFRQSNTALRLSTVRDDVPRSASFQATKTFTHIERNNVPPAPNGRLLAQRGTGPRVTFTFDSDAAPLDTLTNTPLNRASILARLDTTAMKDVPANFVRPWREVRYTVRGIRTAEAPRCRDLGLNAITADGSECLLNVTSAAAPSRLLIENQTAFGVFEETLLNRFPFEQLTLSFGATVEVQNPNGDVTTQTTAAPHTTPLLFFTPEADEETLKPRATLTVTPL